MGWRDPWRFCGWWCRFLFGLGRQHRDSDRVWECAGGALRHSGVNNSLLHSTSVVVEQLDLVVAKEIVQHVAWAGRCCSTIGWRKRVLSGILQHASCAANSKGSGEDLQESLRVGLDVQEMPCVPGRNGAVDVLGVENNGSCCLALQRKDSTWSS